MRAHQVFYISLIALIPLFSLYAQKKPMEFRASALYQTAFTLTGDSTTWPIIVSLADREAASNSFVLSAAAQKRLKEFAIEHQGVRLAMEQTSSLVKDGARVFAGAELDSVTTALSMYDCAIRGGSIEESHQEATQIASGIEKMEKLIEEGRNEPIDARLAQKTGEVNKRKGYSGSWETAFLGDLFVADDGVKTAERSMALLNFVDGVDVTVDPNTIVIIRASKRDKLYQTVKRNIALIDGSLLTKLSEKAKETNDFSFEAGTSQSSVRSGKFWATANRDLNARVSNYDGTIALTASNIRVTLQSNEGTVVRKGQRPLQPIPLLPSPQLNWPHIDSVIYDDHISLEWTRVSGAVKYEIEASPSGDFDREIKRFTSTSVGFELSGVPLAATYIRLHGMDEYGLRGIDSPVYTLIRSRSALPPPIQIDGWDTDMRYTVLHEMTIHGRTRSEVKLSINGKSVSLDRSGAFSYVAHVQEPETSLNILAEDQSGKTSRRALTIVLMDTAKVFQIDWNCPLSGDKINATGGTLEARGTAYPGVRVTGEQGNQHITVSTSPQGEWAISLIPVKGSVLRLTFESIDDSRSIGSKTWKVQ